MKKFWKRTEGFTLVELIVVIAILGILAGVGTVGYSGYVKKANMAADETLISDIRNALTLALYSDAGHTFEKNGMIVVSQNGASVDAHVGDVPFFEAAMTKAFGENWSDVCKLSYGEWAATTAETIARYKETSLSGNEPSLLKKMDFLTQNMSKFFYTRDPNNLPEAIKDVIKEQNVSTSDPTVMTNASVLALANTLGGNTETKNAVSGILTNMVQSSESIKTDENGKLYLDMSVTSGKLQAEYAKIYDDTNMVLLATAATLYAYAESYAQFAAKPVEKGGYGHNTPAGILDIKFNPNASAMEILGQVEGAFVEIMDDCFTTTEGATAGNEWMGGQAVKDASALFTVMDALKDSSSVLEDNLSSSTIYTDGTAAGLIDAYLSLENLPEASAAVIISKDKNVSAYLGGLR